MLTNYFKIALRTLVKFRGYTAINLVGLALGLTAGILIMLFVLDELSYDQFHAQGDRLYRVNTVFQKGESDKGDANETNGWPIGKKLEQDYPEVEAVMYSRNASFLLINHNDQRIRQNIHFATPEFFTLFSFPLVQGNKEQALTKPYAVVISESMQEKYFQGEAALNKTILVSDTLPLLVTGVMKDIPSNSHIQADMIISFATFQALEPGFSFDAGWGNINMRNYVLLKAGTHVEDFSAKIKNIYTQHVGEMLKQWGVTAYVELEPVKKLYLHTRAGNGMGPTGSIDRVYMLTGIAGFVILLACINFINLTTARSVYRSKEVGLRKVVGSTRKGLMAQFLSESLVMTVLALIISIAFIGLVLPTFNHLIGKSYHLQSLFNPVLAGGMVLLILIVALLAGYYPALVLSALRPAEVLKGKMQTSQRGVQLRRTLVVFQFVVSVVLVAGTLVVIDQLRYMQAQSLGFKIDQVVVLNTARARSAQADGHETLRNALTQLPEVQSITFTNALPGTSGWRGQVAYPEGMAGERSVSVEYMAVDDHYLETLGLTLIAGANFDKQKPMELTNGLILNETAVQAFGWNTAEEAIGQKIDSPSGQPAGEVIGVVKDYHNYGLQEKIGPVAMDYAPENSYLFAIQYETTDTQAFMDKLATQWKTLFPGYDFNYFFLDESFARQYEREQRLANVLFLFAFITILIAVIGLLGLVSFMIVARTKEIGVRKIHGASTLSITKLLSKEFVMLVIVANLIAFPMVWYAAGSWLQRFAYHVPMRPLVLAATLAIAIVITLLVVSTQTIRAALSNPVESLRSE